MDQTTIITNALRPASPELTTYTQWIYALHAVSIVVGILGGAAIATAFFGLPSIIAVVMNYARRSAVHGTWLESHFRWQIRTFWFAAAALVITVLVSAPFTLILIGFGFIWIGFAIIGVWLAYRVIRGWLALRDNRPMYT